MCCRPMYIDSTNETEPSGEMPVSRLLQVHIEPLLKVGLLLVRVKYFPSAFYSSFLRNIKLILPSGVTTTLTSGCVLFLTTLAQLEHQYTLS